MWPPDPHLSSVIYHPSSVSPRELQARSENWGDQCSCSVLLLACAVLDCAWLGTCSGPPASSPEWGAGISAGLPNEWAFPPRLPLSYNSSYLRQNQLLMRPLPSGSPSGVSWLPSSLHKEQRSRDNMSLFLKVWSVRWSRLWLPVVRGPEHP